LFSALYAKFTPLFPIDIAALPVIGSSYSKVNITSLFFPLHMFTYTPTITCLITTTHKMGGWCQSRPGKNKDSELD